MMKESNESERTDEEPLNTENDIANVPSILEKYTFTLLKDVYRLYIIFIIFKVTIKYYDLKLLEVIFTVFITFSSFLKVVCT